MPNEWDSAPFAPLRPLDQHNRRLQGHVHPPDWGNPQPAPRYNLVVIGAGTAGLVAAAGAAGLGARVALVERELMGGDCLNVGCVPSKALIRCARAAAEVRDAGRFGVAATGGLRVDFPAIMERLRRIRADISPHDSAGRFRELGVDVFLGQARFSSPRTVEVAGHTLHFARACIATGARAAVPPIPGLQEARFLTNETVFSLTELPRRMAVLGGGPIGCELAQAFARLGSRVTLISHGPRLLPRDDPDAGAIIERQLARDGAEVFLNSMLHEVRAAGSSPADVAQPGHRLIIHGRNGGPVEREVDAILVAVGRAPNVESLGLDAAGVEYDAGRGVRVNDFLQTTNPRVYAAGDVCSPLKFTHVADAHARIVLQNALFLGRARASRLVVPWCTYTSPEVAHVGSTQEQAAADTRLTTITVPLSEVDRARLDDAPEGLLKVHAHRRSGRIAGATLVAPHAGEQIAELSLAMTAGLKLKHLARTIHPYPTQSEIFRKAADHWNRARLTPRLRSWFERFLRWRR